MCCSCPARKYSSCAATLGSILIFRSSWKIKTSKPNTSKGLITGKNDRFNIGSCSDKGVAFARNEAIRQIVKKGGFKVGDAVQPIINLLRDHLLEQVSLTPLPARDRGLVTVLIEALDEDGYLTQSLDEIRETMETAPDTEAYMHGYTYSGHAMACAVGLKNLEIMEREEFPKRARELGKRLLDGLKTLIEFPFVGDVRGLGLVCGVEIVSNKEMKTADPAMAMRIFKAAQERGLRSRPH